MINEWILSHVLQIHITIGEAGDPWHRSKEINFKKLQFEHYQPSASKQFPWVLCCNVSLKVRYLHFVYSNINPSQRSLNPEVDKLTLNNLRKW